MEVNHFEFFFFDAKSQSFVLKSTRNYNQGEQIFITYGNYNNLHFLEYYGFIPYNNPNHFKEFECESSHVISLLSLKQDPSFK